MRVPSLRAAGVCAFFSGAALLTAEVTLRLVRDQDHWDCNSGSDAWVNAFYLLAFLLIALAVLGIQRGQASRAGTWAAAAASAAAIGAVITGLVNAAEHCLHLPIGLVFVVSALATVVALAVFAVSMLRARVFPSWIGVVLLLGTVALQLASAQGGIYLFGLAWVVVGTTLMIRRAAVVE